MKAAVIYDSTEPVAGDLNSLFRDFCGNNNIESVTIDAGTEKLKPCVGCFHCWTKTPGICIHRKDSGMEFLGKIHDADFFLLISEVRWGGYSSAIKYYADRMLPLLHPFFIKVNGEMHHRMRYGHMPELLAAGYGARSEREKKTFMELTAAQSDNMGSNSFSKTFLLVGEKPPVRGSEADRFMAWLAREISK